MVQSIRHPAQKIYNSSFLCLSAANACSSSRKDDQLEIETEKNLQEHVLERKSSDIVFGKTTLNSTNRSP